MLREIVSISAGTALHHVAADVAAFCDVQDAVSLMSLNQSMRRLLSGAEGVGWKMIEDVISAKYNVYVSPHRVKIARGTPKDECFRVWGYRDLWHTEALPDEADIDMDENANRAGEVFNIRVTCRFRPEDPKSDLNRSVSKKVVLPLHQRLEGIKRAANCATTSEAAKILMRETGRATGDPFGNIFDSTPAAAQPEHSFEQRASILNVTPNSVLAVAPGTGMRAFEFDAAFSNSATQQEVYVAAGSVPVRDFINGHDACCIVFGQTGSGKTFTMFGEQQEKGIIPQACHEVMAAIDARAGMIDAALAMSYVEVFGDELTDLLNESSTLSQKKTTGQRWVLEGRAQHSVSCLRDIEHLLEVGDTQKRRAATKMNEKSTRAHALVILTLRQKHIATGSEVSSMLVLADLGGSEDIRRSGVGDGIIHPGRAEGEETANWNAYYQKRERLQEAVHINKGLSSLKSCIRALHARQCGDNVHVPFQNSKLTHLLAPVIGGKASASVLITGSPYAADALETVNTLRFGEDCRAVLTSNSKMDATARAVQRMVQELDEAIKQAEQKVKQNETWVKKKLKRARVAEVTAASDAVDVSYETAQHIDEEDEFTVYRLEGAEEEAKILEGLLEKRRRLLGCA